MCACAGPADTLDALMPFGGFPEPFLAQSARPHRRWQKERLERVASPLSLNALREDLEVSHRALMATVRLRRGSRAMQTPRTAPCPMRAPTSRGPSRTPAARDMGKTRRA